MLGGTAGSDLGMNTFFLIPDSTRPTRGTLNAGWLNTTGCGGDDSAGQRYPNAFGGYCGLRFWAVSGSGSIPAEANRILSDLKQKVPLSPGEKSGNTYLTRPHLTQPDLT